MSTPQSSPSDDDFRIERDSMGEMRVPAGAYYGAQTARAIENFPISGRRMPRRFIAAMGRIKKAAAGVNGEMGYLSPEQAQLIQQAADEVIEGQLDDHFPVDVYQTGSGTSTNMNVNEVIAGRANELATGKRGGKSPVHPNDHVNLQQSSNDVIPTAMHLAVKFALQDALVPSLSVLEARLAGKAMQFDEIVKLGRTHLQDATPIRVGQVLSGYCQQARYGVERAIKARQVLGDLPLGGTAVGTGINSHPEFAQRVIHRLSHETGLQLREAPNHFEAQSAKDAIVEASGLVRTIAVSVHKIANDLRFLSSGPRGGYGELVIPATQPGSSIMPGKVNPVMAEMLMQVVARVIGADSAITWGAANGSNFELNTMMPLMAVELIEAVELLGTGVRIFADRLVAGLEVDQARCGAMVEQSLAMCTALTPLIGYDASADIAKLAFKTGKTVREVATEKNVLSDESLESALDPLRMTSPQSDMIGGAGG